MKTTATPHPMYAYCSSCRRVVNHTRTLCASEIAKRAHQAANAEILSHAAVYGEAAASAITQGDERRAYQLALRAAHYARRGSWDC